MAESTATQLANMLAAAQDAPAFFSKDSKPGDTITGTVSAVSIRQTRDLATNKPESWDDGSPKQQIVVIVDSTDRKTGEVESHSVYIKWWGASRKAFASAVSEGKAATVEIGGQLTVKYVGESEETPAKGMDRQKLWEYAYSAPKA